MSDIRTEIIVVLDRSSSMASVQDETIGGFNAFVKEQKDAPGKAFLTLAQFDTDYEMIHNQLPIEDVPSLQFRPRGMTALFDAVGRTINDTKERLDSQRPGADAVVFVIITDGAENMSREFKREQIRALIADRKEKDEWKFVFIGANQDSFNEAGGIGIDASGVLNYKSTGVGTRGMYESLSRGMSSYRGSVSSSSSDGFSSSSDMRESRKKINNMDFFAEEKKKNDSEGNPKW